MHAASLTKQGITAKANAMGIDIMEGYPIEMHRVYHAWFAWGFWANLLVTLAIGTFWVLENYYNKQAMAIIGYGVSGSLFCCNSIIWLLFGSIWRFSKAGTIASGDRIERLYGQTDDQFDDILAKSKKEFGYQLTGGSFMKGFLLMAGWAITLTALVAFAVLTVICFCDPRDKPVQQDNNKLAKGQYNSHEEDYVLDDTTNEAGAAANQDNVVQ